MPHQKKRIVSVKQELKRVWSPHQNNFNTNHLPLHHQSGNNALINGLAAFHNNQRRFSMPLSHVPSQQQQQPQFLPAQSLLPFNVTQSDCLSMSASNSFLKPPTVSPNLTVSIYYIRYPDTNNPDVLTNRIGIHMKIEACIRIHVIFRQIHSNGKTNFEMTENMQFSAF